MPPSKHEKSEIAYTRRPAGRQQPRNSLCKCGSGKKYKHCCIKAVDYSPKQAIEKVVGFENSFKMQALALDSTN